MLPVLSVVQDVTVIQRRRKYPDVFWLDMPVVSLQSGVLIQYKVMRCRSTSIRGRGEVKKSSPHGAEGLLFSSSFVLL